jgi:hypothetical protein
VIDADQAGNADYNAAPEASQSVTIAKALQTIAITSTTTPVVGGSYTVTATASSGLPVSLSLDPSSKAGACSLNGAIVSFTGGGACVIDANQTGNAAYDAATQAQQSLTVTLQGQTIKFTSTAPTNPTVGATPYTVTASATSNLPITFSIDSSSTVGACSVSGALVTFTGVGACVIDANQAGDGTYNPAPQVQQPITIIKQNQTVAFTSAPPTATVGGTYAVTANASSGLPVAFTLDSGSSGCSLSGSTVSFTAAGTCVIDANQAGNATSNAATQVQQSLTVTQAKTVVTLTFDDGYKNMIKNVLPVMQQDGLHGTFYIISGAINASSQNVTNANYMTWADLQTLYKDGNEIAGHTVLHEDLPDVSTH